MKFTINNILFFIYVGLSLTIAAFFLLPVSVLFLAGNRRKADRYISFITKSYYRLLFFIIRVEVKVIGIENLPSSNKLCFISNHQGFFDIAVIVGYIPKMAGFIAKKELIKIPVLNLWIWAIGCVLIDRKSPRGSYRAIKKGIRQIQNGHPMVIFPEGTRSNNSTMNRFKPGSFKLATESNSIIVPLTIDGTYKIIEETGKLTASTVRLIIHPAIDLSRYSEPEKMNLIKTVESTIKNGLQN